MNGRVALVTGGSRGIGAAVSTALADAGATVVVNYVRDEPAAQAVVAQLAGASMWRADVGDGDAVAAMIDGVVDRHGRLDVLIVNAGVWRGGPIDALSRADWDAVLQTSLTGAFYLTQAAAPALRRSGGRIVVMSSVIGLVGFAGDAAYASAKAGLFGLVRSLAKELGRDGVLVNAVAPGFIDTDMTAAVAGRSRERMIGRTVLGRAGHVSEIAAATRFLACEASYVTGQVLVVDGGFSL